MAVEACETCGRLPGQRHIAVTEMPEIIELQRWMSDGGCNATDGCWVEPDGTCEHGHRSWMLVMGLI